jgi:putative transcriptional regulator
VSKGRAMACPHVPLAHVDVPAEKPMTLVCHLPRLLAERQISQRELARRAGVHRGTIQRLCDDSWWKVDRYVLERLCTALQVTPGELLQWTDD